MEKHTISVSGFDAIGKEILKQDKIYLPDATIYTADPKIIIRDFDYRFSNEREFDNVEKAWEYFKTLSKCRVMDVSGIIYIDSFPFD